VVEITPSVSSFRRKRRKINSPIFVLDSSQSKGSDCDEDSGFKRDKEKGAKEEREKHGDAYRYADFTEPSAIDLTNKIDTVQRPHSYGEKGTDSCDGPKRSSRLMLKSAPTSTQAPLHHSPINTSCNSSSNNALRTTESTTASSSTVSRRNKPSTVTNEPGGVANEFTSTVDDIDTKAQHTAPAQSESDTCLDGNDSVCSRYVNQDCGIGSARAGLDGGPVKRAECSSSSSTLKIKSMMVGSAHRRSSTSEEGCVEGSRVRTQRNAALAVSACPSSPPKTSHESRISDVADGSRCTRSYTATALPFRDGLLALPLQPLTKKYPSTSRSRMSSSLSAAYGSTLSSHSGGGSGTGSSTMRMRSGPVDPHLMEGASSGAEGGVVKSVAIQPLQPVLSSSHASVAQRLSRSASVTSSVSSSAFAAALPVPPRPSLPPTSSRDYRHSSFRARKMLQAAEQIVNSNKNDQL
jgi:hypothetical protein